MASLKDLKVRIGSVKNTQKITKAMKMVAAAKLRRATERAQASRPYAEHMEKVLHALASQIQEGGPTLLAGTGSDKNHLIVVMTSDRGLCGGFNSSIVRSVRQRVALLQGQGKTVKLFCVGRKGSEQLGPTHGHLIVGSIKELAKKQVEFADAQRVTDEVLEVFEKENIDVCTIVYNHFRSAIAQIVTYQQLIPLDLGEASEADANNATAYEFEPEEETILKDLLPRNLATQTYKALLENAASEQGARMTAMDNATRNAGDMIKRLTLQYNRTRQAAITKELIEIISGAEAL